MIALSLATGLLDQSATLRLSINLHPASLPSLRLRAAFSAVPQHIMDRLIVEVTEHGPVTDDGTETLRTLRRAGAAVFLDDFGAGAQSLSLLREGLCDGIKLDRCLIGGISASPEKRAIVRALIALGEELDLMVVAEGIEQQPDADWLQANGIHAMQGYLLGRPQRQARHLGLAVAS
jgi:EAL domain-containing protein (putative c-di-GMP-specific phosphodiesterase class I)